MLGGAGVGVPGQDLRASRSVTPTSSAVVIGELLTAGINLAGVAMVLDLQAENTHLRHSQQAP